MDLNIDFWLEVREVLLVKRFGMEQIMDFFQKVRELFAIKPPTWNESLTFHRTHELKIMCKHFIILKDVVKRKDPEGNVSKYMIPREKRQTEFIFLP